MATKSQNLAEIDKQKIDVNLRDLLIWGEKCAGSPVKDIAKNYGVSDRTVYDVVERIENKIPDGIDLAKFRNPLYNLYPLWISSVIRNLKAGDSAVTIAVGKGLNLLIEKNEQDNNHSFNLSNDELSKRIIDRLKSE